MAAVDSHYLLVAAIDLGTTYSGYAYSFRDKREEVHMNLAWNAGTQRLISQKTPTCLLLNPEKEFDSFGFDAENKFAGLAEDNEHGDWLLFRHFKMMLYDKKNLSKELKVVDLNGTRSMPALTIFAMSLKYLKEKLLQDIRGFKDEIVETDIKYVITVPAIWSDPAKQFMREAAEEAGFHSNRLNIALEPEAASIWCRTEKETKTVISGFDTKYIVVDLGEETADITVHEVGRDATLKELHQPGGGPWSGTYVDKNFIQWMTDIFGSKTMERFKSENMADYFDLLRDFEMKKRNVDTDSSVKCTIKLASTLMAIYEKENELPLSDKISDKGLGEQVLVKADKLRIDNTIVCGFFDTPLNSLVSHLQNILHKGIIMKNVSTILLVGGFGESKLVQRKLQTHFKTKRVLTPCDAALAVIKGAVVFGHQPRIQSVRVMKYAYGLKFHLPFNARKHDKDRAFMLNGEERVYVFRAINKVDESVEVGYSTIMCNMQPRKLDRTIVELYSSEKDEVMYVTDDGCKKLATLAVSHPEGKTLADKKFDLTFIFGETELIVKARIQKTGREFNTEVNYLQESENGASSI